MKMRIKYKALSPISHIGETASTGSYFQTVLTSGGRVPVITANSVRGQLRDSMALHLLELLDTKVDKDTFNILFSGGNINGAMKDDVEKAKSVRRRMVLAKKGLIYETKSRDALTCCPIGNLTDEDIWAYIFSHSLEYLSIYDYPDIDRRKNRNEITLLYNDAMIRRGGAFHYKRMYPAFFAWLKQRWGEVI